MGHGGGCLGWHERKKEHTAHLCEPHVLPSKLSIKSPTQTHITHVYTPHTHTHTPTNRGYEGEINLSFGAIAERTTDSRVPVKTTSRRLTFAAPHPQAFIS